MVCFGWFVAGASRCGSQLGVLLCKLAVQRLIRMVGVRYGRCGPSVAGFNTKGNQCRGPHVCVARRRVSSGLWRRAPHPWRQSARVSSGESLFGTSGANRSTKLAPASGLRLCRGSTGPWQREWLLNPTLYLPNFLERWGGGETTSTTKACVYGHASVRSVDVHTMQSYDCFRRIWMRAPKRRRAGRRTLQERLVICIVVRGHSCPTVRSQ